MDKSDIARALGRLGGQSLAARWKELRERAEAGDAAAQIELGRRRRAMKKRGKKGGRPPKKKGAEGL